jgi:hypothetical protein
MSVNTYAVIKENVVINIVLIEELTTSLESSILEQAGADTLLLLDTLQLSYVKVGTSWDGINFIPQDSPYPSWSWSIELKDWVPPISPPTLASNKRAIWNEDTQEWVTITI